MRFKEVPEGGGEAVWGVWLDWSEWVENSAQFYFDYLSYYIGTDSYEEQQEMTIRFELTCIHAFSVKLQIGLETIVNDGTPTEASSITEITGDSAPFESTNLFATSTINLNAPGSVGFRTVASPVPPIERNDFYWVRPRQTGPIIENTFAIKAWPQGYAEPPD